MLVSKLSDMVVAMLKETDCKDYVNYNNAEQLITSFFSLPVEKCFFTQTNKEGRIIGVICGYLSSSHPFFAPKPVAAEYFWYVEPEYRSTGAGVKLLNQFHDWAKDSGAELIMTTIQSTKDVSKLLERKGYKPTETTFIKEVV